MSQVSEDEHNTRRFTSFMKSTQNVSQDVQFTGELVSLSDTVTSSISNLEKRLATCSGIYSLATNATEIRERERLANNKIMEDSLNQLDERITVIEETIDKIPEVVQKIVEQEFEEQNLEVQYQSLVQQFLDEMDLQINELNAAMDTRFDAQNKTIKGIRKDFSTISATPRENASYDEIESSLSEISARQSALNDILGKLRGKQ